MLRERLSPESFTLYLDDEAGTSAEGRRWRMARFTSHKSPMSAAIGVRCGVKSRRQAMERLRR